jgi:hypothetical protein
MNLNNGMCEIEVENLNFNAVGFLQNVWTNFFVTKFAECIHDLFDSSFRKYEIATSSVGDPDRTRVRVAFQQWCKSIPDWSMSDVEYSIKLVTDKIPSVVQVYYSTMSTTMAFLVLAYPPSPASVKFKMCSAAKFIFDTYIHVGRKLGWGASVLFDTMHEDRQERYLMANRLIRERIQECIHDHLPMNELAEQKKYPFREKMDDMDHVTSPLSTLIKTFNIPDLDPQHLFTNVGEKKDSPSTSFLPLTKETLAKHDQRWKDEEVYPDDSVSQVFQHTQTVSDMGKKSVQEKSTVVNSVKAPSRVSIPASTTNTTTSLARSHHSSKLNIPLPASEASSVITSPYE